MSANGIARDCEGPGAPSAGRANPGMSGHDPQRPAFVLQRERDAAERLGDGPVPSDRRHCLRCGLRVNDRRGAHDWRLCARCRADCGAIPAARLNRDAGRRVGRSSHSE